MDLSRWYPELGNATLWCATEIITKEQIDKAASVLRQGWWRRRGGLQTSQIPARNPGSRGLFFVVVWGILFFGGFTFATEVCIKVLLHHQNLNMASLAGIAFEKLFAGIAWGSTIWFVFVRRSSKE